SPGTAWAPPKSNRRWSAIRPWQKRRPLGCRTMLKARPSTPLCCCAAASRVRRNCRRNCASMLRSEEHTSELQSLAYLVCRLLLDTAPTQLSPLSLHDALPIFSGHRLGTAEVESALVSHPAVAEAAAIGLPHDVKGQAIHTFVLLRSGFTGSPQLSEELRQHV